MSMVWAGPGAIVAGSGGRVRPCPGSADERRPVVGQQQPWDLETCDSRGHHSDLVVQELKDRADRAIREWPLERIELPALVDGGELEPAPAGLWSLLGLRDHHPAAGEDPRQRRGRWRVDTQLVQAMTHRQRPMIPTGIIQLLADQNGKLLDLRRHSLPMPNGPRSWSWLHRRQRTLGQSASSDLTELRPRYPMLLAEPHHGAARRSLRPTHDHAPHVHRDHPVCHRRSIARDGSKCPNEPETEVSGPTKDRTKRVRGFGTVQTVTNRGEVEEEGQSGTRWSRRTGSGSTAEPPPGCTSRCRCGPVTLPVEPV